MGNFGQNDVAKVLAKHFSFQPLDFCFRKPLKSLTAYLRQFASRKNLKFCEVAYVGFPSLSAVQAPRAIAFHHGAGGESHMHIAWSRIDLDSACTAERDGKPT